MSCCCFPLIVETKHHQELLDCCFCAHQEMTRFSKIRSCMPQMFLITMNDPCKEQSHQMLKFLFVFAKPKGITFISVLQITNGILWYCKRKCRKNRRCMLTQSITSRFIYYSYTVEKKASYSVQKLAWNFPAIASVFFLKSDLQSIISELSRLTCGKTKWQVVQSSCFELVKNTQWLY